MPSKPMPAKLRAFAAGHKPRKVRVGLALVSGIFKGDYFYRFTRPVPVKKGDVFKAARNGLILNGKHVPRKVIVPKGKTPYRISRVAKRLRIALFRERDSGWHWVACDVRSYHVGCGDTPLEALQMLIKQCVVMNEMADEESKKHHVVIRERDFLPPREASEMERKARKTGIILDGVEVPHSIKDVMAEV